MASKMNSAQSFFAPVPEPDSKLARYRVLAPKAAVRVSPLCLGAMNLGTTWSKFMGSMDKDAGFKLLDAFYDAGGNFIDTANNYQCEESETWIGEWMAARKNRSQMVIATKYTTNYKMLQQEAVKGPHVNFCGNSAKSLHESVNASLKKLATDYIDILYVHWWDYTAEVEEVMQSLNVLVQQGKVLYLGVSDTPAWVVSKANQYARDHGLRQFVIYQGKWSCAERDFEHDIIPMCRSEGMAIAPWGALGRGKWRTAEQKEAMKASGDVGRAGFAQLGSSDDVDSKMTVILDKISKNHDISITGVALAYVMQKTPYVFPIVGGRKVEHLLDNIKAIGTRLTPEEMKEIEDVTKDAPVPFPHSMIGKHSDRPSGLLSSVAYMDFVTDEQAVFIDKK